MKDECLSVVIVISAAEAWKGNDVVSCDSCSKYYSATTIPNTCARVEVFSLSYDKHPSESCSDTWEYARLVAKPLLSSRSVNFSRPFVASCT